PGADQFALQRISAALLEPCLGPGEEGPPPLLDHLRRNLDLSTDLPKVFAPQEPQHDLRLPLRTPALGQLPRAGQLPFRQHASDLLCTPSSTPKRCPRKSGAIYRSTFLNRSRTWNRRPASSSLLMVLSTSKRSITSRMLGLKPAM